MIGEVFNAMMTMLMAKFMLNDVPHVLGLSGEHPNTPTEPTFSPEARRDLTFCRHIWDLEKTLGRPFTREEVAQRWEDWKSLRHRPKTDEERRLIHLSKYGNEEPPIRERDLRALSR